MSLRASWKTLLISYGTVYLYSDALHSWWKEENSPIVLLRVELSCTQNGVILIWALFLSMTWKFLPLFDKKYSHPCKPMHVGENSSILLCNYQRNHWASRQVQSWCILIECCRKATSDQKELGDDPWQNRPFPRPLTPVESQSFFCMLDR